MRRSSESDRAKLQRLNIVFGIYLNRNSHLSQICLGHRITGVRCRSQVGGTVQSLFATNVIRKEDLQRGSALRAESPDGLKTGPEASILG
jgi:hypothetical protein